MPSLNGHFVSRFLTKPWESDGRQLHFYDFGRKCFGTRSSKNLFARVGRTTAATEGALNRYIETPIASNLDLLTSVGDDSGDVEDWSLVRALFLLHLLQPIRSSEEPPDALALELTVSWDESRLDAAVSRFSQTHALVRLPGHPGAPLHYPSSGVFTMPVQAHDGTWRNVLAIPLTPRFAVAVVPKVAADLRSAISHLPGGFLGNCSAGMSSPQAVIHPDYLASNSHGAVAVALERSRSDTAGLLDLCTTFNDRLAQLRRGSP
jgi:hypothetical protein